MQRLRGTDRPRVFTELKRGLCSIGKARDHRWAWSESVGQSPSSSCACEGGGRGMQRSSLAGQQPAQRGWVGSVEGGLKRGWHLLPNVFTSPLAQLCPSHHPPPTLLPNTVKPVSLSQGGKAVPSSISLLLLLLLHPCPKLFKLMSI